MVTENSGDIVCIGSRLHDFECKDFIISSISPDDKGLNSGNVDEKDSLGTCAEEGLQWRFTLLSVRPSKTDMHSINVVGVQLVNVV